MTTETLLRRITDYGNRADPYPLYEELRATPVARQEDGTRLVGTYREILHLLHDPRISSDLRNRRHRERAAPDDEDDQGLPPAFLKLDPPAHDRMRRLFMRHFGPPHSPRRVSALGEELPGIITGLVDGLAGRNRIDVVDDFAYPFPVTVICRLLGVPREDEPRFHVWADAVVASIDPGPEENPGERRRAGQQAKAEMGLYMSGLMADRRGSPRDDMLSGLVNDDIADSGVEPVELVTNSVLLFVAGHETTVNLIANGMLTLLRNPEVLADLRAAPAAMPQAVEELLRFEPPVHMLTQRTPLTDVEIAGVVIPEGVPLSLVLASGNRDPQRFTDPDRFDPWRPDNQHLGFGGGVHGCFGAPLARLEAQLALTELIRRLDSPRLAADPPEYRRNPVLRGPRRLLVDFDGMRP
ncbi:cytochrome P450 [Streptomyces sp. MUM 178J]|uniref:cytochrome P450 n=1 Tax=Streptomyces sp. MUM 178J TaxID=2791991 RepID=UPI001F033F29|nr:cytochrome P450 [Streptomyces sp. MUM 178J]WRQ79471.1 cytochrome P450 [Streptomyces sp. MUM 178J]